MLHIQQTDQQDNLTIYLSGTLTHDQVSTKLTTISVPTQPNICIDISALEKYDSAGLVALHRLIKHYEQTGKNITLHHIPAHMQSLWAMISQGNQAPPPLSTTPLNRIQILGKIIHNQVARLTKGITYLGELLFYLYQCLRHPRTMRLRKFWYYIDNIGPGSVLLTVLIGVLFGLILSFQSIVQLKKFGAEIYVANLVSVSLIRELGPLLMAIILIGRIASAYAAEISAMKVNQELDALNAMGLNPIPFLVIPRLLAAALIAPLVTLILDAAALFGCGLLMLNEGFGVNVIIKQMFDFVQLTDILTSMLKSSVFGLITIGIGCVHGLKSGRDAMAVGQATTATVVQCIVTITVVDGIFTGIFYCLGL